MPTKVCWSCGERLYALARFLIDLHEARRMARALAYDLTKETYKLDTEPAFA